MIVLFLLIPLSIVIASVFLLGFVWAVRSGQYEDTCTPALRLLGETPHPGQRSETKDVAERKEEQIRERD